MISEVKTFIEAFFKTEVEARNAYVRSDTEFANSKLDELNSFCIPELYDSFGMTKTTYSNAPGFYQQHGNTIYFERKLFKISQYSNGKYIDLFLAYVSDFSDLHVKTSLSISACFFVAKVNNDYKIVRSFFFGGDGPIPKWNPSFGDEEITFKTAGKLMRTEHYLEPKEDEFSMLEYTKEI